MNCLYFLVILSILVILPYTINAFFRQRLDSINVIRNLTCQLDNNETLGSDFQLCAIRFYRGQTDATVPTFTLFNGLRYVNTFLNLIQRHCDNWPTINGNITDIGVAVCRPQPEFETFTSVQICICATDNCNQNMSSCQQAIGISTKNSQLFNLMPDLPTNIQCSDTLNASNTCDEHPFINILSCEEYVRKNSVLCTITTNGTQTTQTSLIYENYAGYLDEKIHQVRSALLNAVQKFSTESDTNVYYNYSINDIDSIEECACTNYSFCNKNTGTCSTLVVSEVETTIPIPSFTNSSSSTLTYTSATITDTSASSTTTITTITSTDSSTITTYENFTTIITTTNATTLMTSEDFTTMISSTNATTLMTSAEFTTIISSTNATTAMTSAEFTTIIPSTNATTAMTSAEFTTIIPSTNATAITSVDLTTTITIITTTSQGPIVTSVQSYAAGETGLGRAATAGIACGIIFSAVIFTAEIVFFKFFYSGNVSNGFRFERSVAYRA